MKGPTCTPAICMTQQKGKWNFEREWTYCAMTRRSFHRPNPRNAANQVSDLTFLRRYHGQNLTSGGMYVQCGVLLRKIWEGNELESASMLMCKQWKLWSFPIEDQFLLLILQGHRGHKSQVPISTWCLPVNPHPNLEMPLLSGFLHPKRRIAESFAWGTIIDWNLFLFF